MGILRDAMAVGTERWIRSRTPHGATVTLGQRQIFVMPNRYGLGMLVLILILFVMGTNYQNNLVLALSYWLLALFVLSIWLTYYNLAGLRLKAISSQSAPVGEPLAYRLHLHSHRERFGLVMTGGDATPQWLDRLPAHDHAVCEPVRAYCARGRYPAPRVRLETRFPFGWITAWTFWSPALQGLVWPACVDHGVTRVNAEDTQNQQTAQKPRPERDALDAVRDYEPGDPTRRILWRQFARRGALHVKSPPNIQDDSHQLDIEQVSGLPLEQGLEQLAFWVTDCEAREADWSLRLGQWALPPGRGDAQRERGMDALALYSGQGGTS